MSEFNKTAVLGGGVIGASWTALFLAAGKDVCVFDVDEQAPEKVTNYVDRAWPTLLELGLAQDGRRGAFCVAPAAGAAERCMLPPPRRSKAAKVSLQALTQARVQSTWQSSHRQITPN